MLGEGSSASAWRDVRPSPSGNSQRTFHEPYFDDSTDDDDSGSVFTGFGRRESADHMGSSGPGAGTGIPGSRGRSSIDSPNRSHLQRHTTKLDIQPTPGPFKSLWQKMVGPKQAIALDGTNTPDPTDSDGARSSIESTGHEGGHVPSSYTGRNTFRPDRNSSSAAGRTGPALMFASVQQQPSSYSRSSLQEDENRDRDRLLSVHDARTRHGGSSAPSSRTHSPQGRVIGHGGQAGQGGQGVTNSGRNSRPNSRIFGASSPQHGNSANRQPSPLVNIFDDDD